jgi:penicillin amidase
MLLKKKLKITAVASAAVIILSAIILLAVYNIFKISYNENEKSEIDSQITITRDDKGIPTITADTPKDFYFALGFLHAKDRPNVLEYLRAIATGDSAKFAGDDAMFLNNLCKTIGFTKNAAEVAVKLNDNEISALKSYVRGINHIQNKNRVRNLANREWRVEDIIAILTMKEWANSYLNNKELIFNLPETKIQISKKIFAENRYLYFYYEDDTQYLYTLRRIKEIIEKYMCTFARGNSIYIPSKFSISGIDSYTTLNYDDSTSAYPGWYPVRLEMNGKNTYAVTYSGLPFILSFKNDSVSLTQININADSQTFYLFDTQYQESVPHYKSAGTWKKYKTIRVPVFAENEITSEIKWVTEKGPVFSDLIASTKSDSRIMVIDSVHPGAEYVSMMLKLPFETEIEKIRQAAMLNDSPLKCFIISDNKTAYKMYTGLINPSDNNNLIFKNGSMGVRPAVSKISIINKISGIDYSGSDLTSVKDISSNYRNTISNEFKIERFNKILLDKPIYNNEHLKDIISDNVSVAAEKFIPLFKSYLENNPLTSAKLAMIYFNDWDYSANPGLQSPSIFFTTLQLYIEESYKDIFGRDSDFNLNNAYLLYPEFLDQCQKRNSDIFDNPESENSQNRETKCDIAFLNAMRFLNRKEGPLMEDWKWGQINKSNFKIPNIKLNYFSSFFKIEDMPLSGGPDTIESLLQNNRFSIVSATSFQSIMDTAGFRFKMNTGYSTAILSDFYYSSNIINEFQNIGVASQTYKTTINK